MDTAGERTECNGSHLAELQGCLERCNDLLREFDEFKEHLKLRGLNHAGLSGQEFPGLGTHTFAITHHVRHLNSAIRKIQYAGEKHQQDGLPSASAERYRQYEAEIHNSENRWNITKRCRGLSSMGAFFSSKPSPGQNGTTGLGPAASARRVCGKGPKAKHGVFVDAVAEGGAKWVRVFSLSSKRLLDEMAHGGYDVDPESGSYEPRWIIDNSEDDEQWSDGEDTEKATVLSEVRALVQAARANLHSLRPPQIQVILTKIISGQDQDVDKLIERLRSFGGNDVIVALDCANTGTWLEPTSPLQDVLGRMIYDERDYLTPTLNIDQDIIAELISDMTNTFMKHQPWHVHHVTDQITRDGPGSPRPLQDLWDVLGSRRLVCTREAAAKLHTLALEMGTDTEQARAMLVLPPRDGPTRAKEEVLDELQKLCIHPIPRHLQIPVDVVDDDYAVGVEDAVEQGKLPKVAITVARTLGSRDGSIFLYGWANGYTTLSCNRTTMKKINRVVSQSTNDAAGVGPRMWCPPRNTGNLARRENISASKNLAKR